MLNTPIGFKISKDSTPIDIDYVTNIKDTIYSGSSIYSTITIDHLGILNTNDKIYIRGSYNNISINKLYLYNHTLVTNLLVTDMNNIVTSIDETLDTDIFMYMANINIVNIDKIIFKLYYTDTIARESTSSNNDILLLETIKDTNLLNVVYKKSGNYRLVAEVIDMYNNLYTIETDIHKDISSDPSGGSLRNVTNYIEWE